MMLIERSVIQWKEDLVRDKFERILWSDKPNNLVVLFPLTPKVTESTFLYMFLYPILKKQLKRERQL